MNTYSILKREYYNCSIVCSDSVMFTTKRAICVSMLIHINMTFVKRNTHMFTDCAVVHLRIIQKQIKPFDKHKQSQQKFEVAAT